MNLPAFFASSSRLFRRTLAAAAGLALTSLSFAATVQINFGNNSSTGWNNVTSAIGQSDTGTLADLIDSTGAITAIDLAMNARYNSVNTNGASSGTSVNGFGIPDAIAATSLFGNSVAFAGVTATQPTFTLSNLDKSLAYTFTVYASRVGVSATEKRTGVYTATGLNTVSGTVDAANNTSVTLTLLNVRPDASGNIVFSMTAAADNNSGNKFVHLNALTLTSATPVPEPSSVAVLIGTGALLVAVIARRPRATR